MNADLQDKILREMEYTDVRASCKDCVHSTGMNNFRTCSHNPLGPIKVKDLGSCKFFERRVYDECGSTVLADPIKVNG